MSYESPAYQPSARTISNSYEKLGKDACCSNCSIEPECFTQDITIAKAIKMVNQEISMEKDTNINVPGKFN
jgi:hypothetical protein